MKKNLLFAANWKMHKNPKETREFLAQLLERLPDFKRHQVVIFPPAACLEAASQVLSQSEIRWGCQNCYSKNSGAFTGETSAQVVKDLGGQFVLVGHSERRTLFAETDAHVAEKAKNAQELGLIPMICIGENLQQREGGHTQNILRAQLEAALAPLSPAQPFVIAYEPVWAIGTGKVATVEQVQQAHHWVRQLLVKLNPEKGLDIPILYGGSVKPDNAKSLSALPEVFGFLIGGAALELDSFLAICGDSI